jgi:hypothetical protein
MLRVFVDPSTQPDVVIGELTVSHTNLKKTMQYKDSSGRKVLRFSLQLAR